MPQVNPYPLRVDPALMERFKRLAAENSRSFNQEAVYILMRFVESYEKENGAIAVDTESLYQ